MHHKEEEVRFRRGANCADRIPSLLAILVDTIKFKKEFIVPKNLDRHIERDAAMFLLITPVFVFVPFVSHIVYTDCMPISPK